MKPVTYEHKEYKATVRYNPQTQTYVVFVYRNNTLIERQTFASFEVADDYAYRVTIIEDLCDRLGLR